MQKQKNQILLIIIKLIKYCKIVNRKIMDILNKSINYKIKMPKNNQMNINNFYKNIVLI